MLAYIFDVRSLSYLIHELNPWHLIRQPDLIIFFHKIALISYRRATAQPTSLEAVESQKVPEIKGFLLSYVSFLDIHTTVSTCEVIGNMSTGWASIV